MKRFLLALAGMLSILGPGDLTAQNSYMQTNLTANLPGVANNTDPQLSNSWGIAFLPGNPFWIADNNSGLSTLYDAQGNKQQLVVSIPGAANNPCTPGCPTGIVANSSNAFGGGAFLFDTEDGIIASWNGAASAVKLFDNSASGAVYKGLAMVNNSAGSFLLAANFNSGKIDVFDRNLKMTSLSGSFEDPNLPVGFAPHGVHVLNNQVYIAFAMQDAAKHDPQTTAGSGVVDIFDMTGNFVRRLAAGGTLNAPWGVLIAPPTFGAFANDVLVGNFGDGAINAFDPGSGSFLGQLMDTNGSMIVNPGLWDMVLGQGGTGDPNTVYFTAGGADQTHGLFATLVPSAMATGPDFSLSVSPATLTIPRGGSGSLMVIAAASGGFNTAVSLSCSNLPARLSCSFSPATIMPGSSTATSTMSVTVASDYPVAALRLMMSLPFAFALLGIVVSGDDNTHAHRRRWIWIAGLLILNAVLLLSVACAGAAGGMGRGMNLNNVTMMVTRTAGGMSHSTPVTLTIQ